MSFNHFSLNLDCPGLKINVLSFDKNFVLTANSLKITLCFNSKFHWFTLPLKKQKHGIILKLVAQSVTGQKVSNSGKLYNHRYIFISMFTTFIGLHIVIDHA